MKVALRVIHAVHLRIVKVDFVRMESAQNALKKGLIVVIVQEMDPVAMMGPV